MATPRKRFFTVECSLYREPWPRELKLTLVMLGMHMTDRWASDRLTPRQATVARLSLGDLLTITGTETRANAHEVLRELASVTSIKVQALDNGFVRIEWPKLAKTQWSKSRDSGSKQGSIRARKSPKVAPSDSHPHPHSHLTREEQEKSASAARPAKSRHRTVKSEPPSDLDSEQKLALLAWVRSKHPALEPRLRDLVDACLDYHRANGNHKADWLATCQTWIRNEAEGRFGRQRAPNGIAQRMEERAAVLADVARQAMELGRQREQRKREQEAANRSCPDPHVRLLRADANGE